MGMSEEQMHENIEKNLSVGAREAIVLMANAFRFGCNWGFIKSSHPNYKDVLQAVKEEKGNVELFQVSNGAVVMARKSYLAQVVNKVIDGLIGPDFVRQSEERAKKESESALKFIRKVADGKSPYVQEKDGYQELQLGIFSTNQVNEIRLNGIAYPAFRLTTKEALGLLDHAKTLGVEVMVRGVQKDGSPVFGTPMQLGGNSAALEAAFRGLEISDTDTGVFMTVRLRHIPGFQKPVKPAGK